MSTMFKHMETMLENFSRKPETVETVRSCTEDVAKHFLKITASKQMLTKIMNSKQTDFNKNRISKMKNIEVSKLDHKKKKILKIEKVEIRHKVDRYTKNMFKISEKQSFTDLTSLANNRQHK